MLLTVISSTSHKLVKDLSYSASHDYFSLAALCPISVSCTYRRSIRISAPPYPTTPTSIAAVSETQITTLPYAPSSCCCTKLTAQLNCLLLMTSACCSAYYCAQSCWSSRTQGTSRVHHNRSICFSWGLSLVNGATLVCSYDDCRARADCVPS